MNVTTEEFWEYMKKPGFLMETDMSGHIDGKVITTETPPDADFVTKALVELMDFSEKYGAKGNQSQRS